MEDLKEGKLTVECRRRDHRALHLHWLGESSDQEPARFLTAHFDRVLKEAASCEEVILDFQDITFMNSATTEPLLRFIKGMEKAPSRLRLVYDETKLWQRAMFRCYKIIFHSNDNIIIEASTDSASADGPRSREASAVEG